MLGEASRILKALEGCAPSRATLEPPPRSCARGPTLHVVLEELLCAELQDVVQLLLGHGARLGAQAGPHHQVGEHHLTLGHLRDPLLHGGPRDKAVNHHLLVLADAVGAAEGLGETAAQHPGLDQGGWAQGWVPQGGDSTKCCLTAPRGAQCMQQGSWPTSLIAEGAWRLCWVDNGNVPGRREPGVTARMQGYERGIEDLRLDVSEAAG